MMPRIYAYTQNSTAAAETAVCEDCRQHNPIDYRDPSQTYDPGEPIDVSDNPDVACEQCGATGADYHDVTYLVTLSIPDDEENPGESEIEAALYIGLDQLATRDAIYVERQP